MSTKYRQKNDDSLLVRLPSNLKNDFKHCCDLLDVPVAEVMRVLMADFLKENNDFVLTNGGWGVKSNSAKKIVRRKERKAKINDKPKEVNAIAEDVADISEINNDFSLSPKESAELLAEINQIHEEAERDFHANSLDISSLFAPSNNSPSFLPDTRMKPSFGNPNLSRSQRMAIESQNRKKRKKKR